MRGLEAQRSQRSKFFAVFAVKYSPFDFHGLPSRSVTGRGSGAWPLMNFE
jgi:hypothetical protein